MAKKYDMAVKTGSYQDRNRVDKGRYENVGEVHSGKDGGFYARMNPFRLVGLAMAAIARGDDSMLVSLFEPRTDNSATPGPQHYHNTHAEAKQSNPPAPQTAGDDDFDDFGIQF